MLKQKEQKYEFMEFVRTTSVGCSSQPRDSALAFLRSGDLRSFVDIVNNPDVEAAAGDPGHWINQPVEEGGTSATLLDEAVTLGKHDFVSVLVRVGAIRDLVNTSTGLSPLHLACQAGEARMLELLLGEDDMADPNVRAGDRKGGFTPLHLAAQTRAPGHLKCLELLLQRDDTNVDARDVSSVMTPLFVAVEARNEAAARALIQNGANVDAKCGKSTIREYLPEYLPTFDPRSVRVLKTRPLMENLEDKLMEMVRRTKMSADGYKADLANFRTFVRFIRSAEDSPELAEVFNLACEKGLHEHAALLLQKGVDPNNKEKPILEVAYKGYHKVLEVMLRDSRTNLSVIKPQTRESVLHLVLKMEFEQSTQENYARCWAVLMGNSKQDYVNQVKRIINKKDGLGNTALHYATQKWNDSVVRNLLELGANIGIKNYWNEIPIAKIRPQTMEDFLDEHCLVHEGDTMHENFELSFQYGFLAPDAECLPDKYRGRGDDEDGAEQSPHQELEALPETESLWYMGQSKEHRHLLKHPVITSFLWYKWQRIRKYFNRNIRLYILFVFLLTWYIFKEFGSASSLQLYDKIFYFIFLIMFITMGVLLMRDLIHEISQSRLMAKMKHHQTSVGVDMVTIVLGNLVEAGLLTFMALVIVFGGDMLRPGLTALLVILLSIEIFQLLVSLKRYFFQMENWIENATIVLCFVILYNDREEFEVNRNLAAIAILLSWSRMITLIGKHPKNNHLNIYVTMFFKVLWSFFSFLSWYGLFIIAFGLSFFIMLHEDVKIRQNNPADDDGDDKYEYFNTTFLSVVKTMTMFVGELEFSDIPINLDSALMPVNFIFFLSFVFLIVVVLMNLLNGLAVSDTGAIQEQAEIYSYLSRVETISYLESVLLGDPFDFLSNVPRFLTFLPSCSVFRQLYRSNILRRVFTKIGASNILLFYNYLPEKRSPILRPNSNQQDCSCLSVDDMGVETIEAAKRIVSRKTKLDSEDDLAALMKKINAIELKLASIGQLDLKLDTIIRKIS